VETITSTPAGKTGIANQKNVTSRFLRMAIAGVICLMLGTILVCCGLLLIWPTSVPSLYHYQPGSARRSSSGDSLALNQSAASLVASTTNSPVEASPVGTNTDSPAKASPTMSPDAARTEIDSLIRQSNYAAASQLQIAYFDHAREQGESDPVRLSFGMMGWQKMIGHYPAARQELVDLRDIDIQEFKEAASYTSWTQETNYTGPGQMRTRFALFEEISAINGVLNDNDAQTALVKMLIGTDRKLAQAMGYKIHDDAFDILKKKAAKGEDVGDGQAAFKVICQQWESIRKHDARLDEVRAKQQAHMDAIREQAGLPTMPIPHPPSADSFFVNQTRQLIKILVANGHVADAEKVLGQAIALVDDPWLKSAISDAQTAMQNQSGASTQH
jgi:hypothetical protein